MDSKKEIQQLAYKWLKGTITDEEMQFLENWYNQQSEEELMWTRDEDEESLKNKLFKKINEEVDGESINTSTLKKIKKQFYRYAAAAVVVLALGLWYGLDSHSHSFHKKQEVASAINLPPGKDAATLILSDGSVVQLDSVNDGEIAAQGNSLINKNGGEVSYVTTTIPEGKKEQISFNTINTARGNQYRLTLSDGTKIWLNSASSLRFPTAFTGDVREIELSGEAYFEVAKDEHKPFVVKLHEAEIEVLGTHFNVFAYDDEQNIKTTLLEGSVKVSDDQSSVKINPEEQAIVGKENSEIKIEKVDINQVMAWKEGFFEFDDTPLPQIMRQISRWYDVDIRYEGQFQNEKFGGRISKNLKLGNILTLLEANGVQFTLEEKTLIVKFGNFKSISMK